MTYVMSDLHGCLDKYYAMLDKIAFSDSDTLYVLGDIIDRGEHPVELLRDMSMRPNVVPLLGNHELTAAVLLRKLCTEITEENFDRHLDADFLRAYAAWCEDGGETTAAGFRRCGPEEREILLDYICDFSPYEILTAGENRFILVHGGIPYAQRKQPLETFALTTLTETRPDYLMRYFDNAFFVTGHTPTIHIDSSHRGKIYMRHGHIAVDCGAVFGLGLGCIRLEDFREYYV